MTVRELVAKLGLDVDAGAFVKAGGMIEVLRLGVDRLVGAAVDAAAQFADMVQTTAASGREIQLAAQTTGLAADEYQRLSKAASVAGVEGEKFSHGILVLSRMMAAAKGGAEAQVKAFRDVGVAYTGAEGKLRGAGDVLRDVATRMAALPDGAAKTALAMQLFGETGATMIPLLNLGGEKITEMGRSAAVMTQEQLDASRDLVLAQKQLGAVTQSVWRGAIYPLIPALRDLVREFVAWRKANADVMRQGIQSFLGALLSTVRTAHRAFAAFAAVAGVVQREWRAAAAVVLPLVALWAASNARLALSFVVAEAKAAWAARSMLWSWVKVAGPFAAVAGAILLVMGLLDDFRTYKKAVAEGGTGRNTLFGRYREMLSAWLKPSSEDPWWLRAIKALTAEMAKALGMAKELGLVGGTGTSAAPAPLSYGSIPRPYIAARTPPASAFRDEDPNAWSSRALRALGVTDPQWVGRLPEVRATGGGAPVVNQANAVTINVNGGDPAEVRRVVGQELDKRLDERGVVDAATLQATAAAVPAY